MKIEKIYKISCEHELIFAKNDLKNFLTHKNHPDVSFFLFALMEIGTNLLKYPKKGEVWLLSEDDNFILAALDKGEGIKNLEWAIKRGTSTKNTLGLGLYQLSQNENYSLEIFTSTKNPHGTIILIKPKKLYNKIVYLIRNSLDLPYGGDFVLRKGKYVILGDISGHGKKAFVSGKAIKQFFFKRAFSCLLIDEFLFELHKTIKNERLRSLVVSILEITKFGVNICGVGSNNLFIKDNAVKTFSFKDGIIGEAFSSASKYSFKDFNQIFLTSDGIDDKMMYNILQKTDNLYLSVIAGVYFSESNDDKSIVGVRNGL